MSNMVSPYKRKKAPELVRRALLDSAARLAVEGGLAAVTVQAVSQAAGVTKGGFLHHFPSKQSLIASVFQEMLEAIDEILDAKIATDTDRYGTFTRAYVQAVFETESNAESGPWAALSMTWLTDSGLRALWADWFQQRLNRHRDTDNDISLTAVRMAADGIWLAELAGVVIEDRNLLHARLVESTRAGKSIVLSEVN
ncbi:AcrR family transcriptional regulator [Pseudomonas sp. BIGb0408]|uniref:AcrR family transcriptional regulator n=1 Tax=Phytopseudomonas flavescens TaxID=29435 RepID=A0A7Y9XKN4_9GAMM|nr:MULTISPECIES: TetR/AcrR family transcriptional regulator [Pseudomonas]MCW2292308.1 AcrR family transcriptional regulator [Pseudomonas sp. BIGb0408]NYH73120.1 AcrR family transcriptional regulator [Pseudomonas flavescens]